MIKRINGKESKNINSTVCNTRWDFINIPKDINTKSVTTIPQSGICGVKNLFNKKEYEIRVFNPIVYQTRNKQISNGYDTQRDV